MTSVERVIEYTELPSESLNECKKPPPDNWPSAGEIIYENVSFSYDKANNLPMVLNDLSFRIDAGEKVGIVGRTGAGKSSIFQTILRLAEVDGVIRIDGIDVKELSLKDVRSRLSIIPVKIYSFKYFRFINGDT